MENRMPEFYTFTADLSEGKRVTIEIDGEKTRDELLTVFEDFLRACGRELPPNANLTVSENIVLSEEETSTFTVNDDPPLSLVEDNMSVNVSEKDWYFTNKPEIKAPYIDAQKLKDAVIPFLENLKKDPEKVLLRWPNRASVIEDKISEINEILSGE
jgi:hypothetical protein